MKPPIIADDHGDISVFNTVEDAEREIEPDDVRAGTYTLYDSEGRLLETGLRQPTALWRRLLFPAEQTVIREAEREHTHREQLHEALADFLARVGLDERWISKASLEELIVKA